VLQCALRQDLSANNDDEICRCQLSDWQKIVAVRVAVRDAVHVAVRVAVCVAVRIAARLGSK